MLFLGALSIKIVNDRVGILGFWLPDRRVDSDEFAGADRLLNSKPHHKQFHQKKKRKISKK